MYRYLVALHHHGNMRRTVFMRPGLGSGLRMSPFSHFCLTVTEG